MFKSFKDFIAESMQSNPCPNLLDRIHLRRARGKRDDLDVGRDFQTSGFVPSRTVCYKQNKVIRISCRQFAKEDIHAYCVAVRQDEKERFTKVWVHSAIRIAILADMMAWYIRANPLWTPAISWLVDSPKARLILKHEQNATCQILEAEFLSSCVNFFEASITSGDDFSGCWLRGLTLRQL